MRITRKAIVVFVLLGVAAGLWQQRVVVRDWYGRWRKPEVPSPMPYAKTSPSASVRPVPSASATPQPSAVNLDVPFVPQAPYKIWDHDHEEFCEEAASLMAASYVRGDASVADAAVAEERLQAIKAYEIRTFGYFEDTNAQETARIIREYLGIAKVSIMNNPTAAQIRSWLVQRRIVLVPAAGRLLYNPNFKQPGPLYHMVLLKGYTADGQFIANDPGTRNGADYLYDEAVIMNAMHDWNGGDVLNGRKIVIVVG